MIRLPSLFLHEYRNGYMWNAMPLVRMGYEWVMKGQGSATVLLDGYGAYVLAGQGYLYGEYPPGHDIPEGAVELPNNLAEQIATAYRMPLLIPINNRDIKEKDRLFAELSDVIRNAQRDAAGLPDGHYTVIGKNIYDNPYGLSKDHLVRDDLITADVPRTFSGIMSYLAFHNIYGLVFWKDGVPHCVVKRSDFCLRFPDEAKPVEIPPLPDTSIIGG